MRKQKLEEKIFRLRHEETRDEVEFYAEQLVIHTNMQAGQAQAKIDSELLGPLKRIGETVAKIGKISK